MLNLSNVVEGRNAGAALVKFPEARLLIFMKAPIPGRVKTRLFPALGPYRAAMLQRRLSEYTLGMASQARLCPIEVWCEPDIHHPFFGYCRRKFGAILRQQHGSDLGRRMYEALRSTLRQAKGAIIVGTDCPMLTAKDLEEALAALAIGTDVVVGPAEDGGYILIGGGRVSRRLFSGIGWGSNRVLQQTRARLQMLNWKGWELEPRWDVDRPQDLRRLEQEAPGMLSGILTPETPKAGGRIATRVSSG